VVDDAIEKGVKKDEAILKELQKLIKSSKKIRFEGNGYGDAWVKEAEKRGLSNLKDTPRAIKTMVDKKTKKLFADLEVFTEVELDARYEIELENYILKLQIESRALGDIARNHILPTAFKYQNVLLENIKGMKEVFGSESKTLAKPQEEILRALSLHTSIIKQKLDEMLEERKLANKIDDPEKKALAYCDKIKPYFDEIKYNADKLELLIDDAYWPLPKLREILFTK